MHPDAITTDRMEHPLIRHRDARPLILPPQMCGSTGYYALMASYPEVIIADDMRWDKRYKSVHRFTIADPHGPLTLTVPVSRPPGAATWDSILLSDHGHWWTQHARSLATAYSAGPFYEYYIDRFAPMLSPDVVGRYVTVTALAAAWDAAIRSALHLPCRVTHRCSTGTVMPPACPHEPPARLNFDLDACVPHYRLTPHPAPASLSILDLIFNTGPEAPLILRDLAAANDL